MLNFDDFEVLTFDCYGTLIDWECGILLALKPVLDSHKIDLGDDEILERYAELESEAQNDQYTKYRTVLTRVIGGFGEKYDFTPSDSELRCLEESLQYWIPFPDTVDALEALKTKFKLAVVSNIDNHLFSYSAKHLKVDFDYVITAEEVRCYKPSLNIFRAAIERIGISRDRILHVAQSVYHDIVPANQLGLSTVWINRRHRQHGFGATPRAAAQPDLEVPDLKTLVSTIGL